VIIMDVQMPGSGGLAAAHRIRKLSPTSKVLILSAYDDEEYVVEALGDAGAAGYILKTDTTTELLAAVRLVDENIISSRSSTCTLRQQWSAMRSSTSWLSLTEIKGVAALFTHCREMILNSPRVPLERTQEATQWHD